MPTLGTFPLLSEIWIAHGKLSGQVISAPVLTQLLLRLEPVPLLFRPYDAADSDACPIDGFCKAVEQVKTVALPSDHVLNLCDLEADAAERTKQLFALLRGEAYKARLARPRGWRLWPLSVADVGHLL